MLKDRNRAKKRDFLPKNSKNFTRKNGSKVDQFSR